MILKCRKAKEKFFMKVLLFVKRTSSQDESGNLRTRYNFHVRKSAKSTPIPIDVVYQRVEGLDKDPLYMQYRSVLESFADDFDDPCGAEAVELCVLQANQAKFFYLICGNVTVPIRVPDYGTPERPDYAHNGRVISLFGMSTLVSRAPKGLLSYNAEEAASEVETPADGADIPADDPGPEEPPVQGNGLDPDNPF